MTNPESKYYVISGESGVIVYDATTHTVAYDISLDFTATFAFLTQGDQYLVILDEDFSLRVTPWNHSTRAISSIQESEIS
jgi:hypothetical protein